MNKLVGKIIKILSLAIPLVSVSVFAQTPDPNISGVEVPGTRISNAISNTRDMGYAMDGRTDTYWNSLAYPQPTWIDVDLGKDYVIDTVALNPTQTPSSGWATHNIYGRTAAGEWAFFGTIQQYTTDGQWFSQSFPNQNQPVRYVVIQTTYAGGSWVAWREIKVTARANQFFTYTLTASAGGGGTISPSGTISVLPGTSKSFTVTPNKGFRISSVGGTCNITNGAVFGPSISGVYNVNNINSNCTITATFKPEANNYVVTASASPGGTISPSGNLSTPPGTTRTFTITPNANYKLSSLGGNCPWWDFNGNSYTTAAINSDCTVVATFVPAYYTVTASAGAGGTINPSGSLLTATGTSRKFTVTPNAGYKISSVSGCGGSFSGDVFSSGTYGTDWITSNCTVVANFTKITNYYTITASVVNGTGGTISPSVVTVPSGGRTTFTAIPNTGYKWTFGGTCNGQQGAGFGPSTDIPYNVNNVTANCTVTVIFTKK